MGISREPFPVHIMTDQKRMENVEYFRHLCSMITNDEIKFWISMDFNRNKILFTSKLDLNLRKKLVKCYIWSIEFCGVETWTHREVDQKYLKNF
jgi:hypothetical protein